MGRLVIDGNRVYEVDETCLEEKRKKEKQKNSETHHKDSEKKKEEHGNRHA